MRLFHDVTGRYSQAGLDAVMEDEQRVIDAYRNLIRIGIHPRDAFNTMVGALFEAMCDAVIELDTPKKEIGGHAFPDEQHSDVQASSGAGEQTGERTHEGRR